jgi:hypothetical protein
MQTYSAQDFVKALGTNELDQTAVMHLSGLVKLDATQPNVLLLAPWGCGEWLPVPLALIEKVEDLGKRPCRDHVHRYVRVTLKDSRSPEAGLLRALLQHLQGEPGADEGEPFEADAPNLGAPRARALSSRARTGFDCERACAICRRTGKAGPCSVCENQCGDWGWEHARAWRDADDADWCADCIRRCGANPGCKQGCMRRCRELF